MKKVNKKYTKTVILFTLIIFFIFLSFIAIKFINKDSDVKKNNNIDYDDMIFEINVATYNNFQKKNELGYILHIPIDILNDTEYNFYFDEDTNEYFLVAKIIPKKKVLELEKYIEIEKKHNEYIKYGNNTNYMYIINSKDNTSTIEGIIRNYIY